MLSTAERTRLIRRVIDEAIGLGVLEPLLADPSVTEIMVNGPDEVYLERDGRLERADITFTDEGQLYQTIDRIVSQVNRRVDESSPMVDARLPTGERVNVIIPPLALRGPTMTIRRFPRLFTLDQLTEMNSIDAPTDAAAARGRRGQAQRRHLRRHGRRQDDAAERDVGGGAARRAHHHRRGQRRAAPPAAARGHARGAAVERRGQGRGLDPRPRAQLAAHAPRPHHRRRGPRRGDARHAAGAQHRPRGLAGDRARQLARRRDPPPRDAGDDERPPHPVRGAARPDQLRDPRDRADRPLRRRQAPHRRGRDRRLDAARDVPARHRRALRGRPDRPRPQASNGRFRHFPLPPAIHRRLEQMGLEIPPEFGPEADLEQTPVRKARRWRRTPSR